MTWTSLVASKGVAGSIMNWVSYSKLDVETVVDEAQSLLFQMLRVREMRSEWTFGMAIGQANQALPDRFLDPIGKIFDVTNGTDYGHVIESEILRNRSYDTSPSGALGTDPFTVTINVPYLRSVKQVAHGLTQGSTIAISNVTDTSWVKLNGSFAVVSITDADNFVVYVDALSAIPGATQTGGGSGITWTANKLVAGSPTRWAVWDEQAKFDTAFDAPATLKLLYYRSPLPLSATNQSNWLTTRYPMLMRKACQASAADFMKDDVEYKKGVDALSALIQSTAAVDDLSYRGAEFGTDTP